MALQELQNRSAADQASAKFTEDLGRRHAEYSSLRGQAAVDAFPQYIADVHQLRDDGGADLNPMAKRYYDAESRGMAGRTIFNGAGHAGEQQKQALAGSAKAVLGANAQGAFNTPEDEVGFQKRWDAVPEHVATLSGVAGWDQQQTANEVFKQRSELRAQQIIGLSRTAPMKAAALLEQHKSELEYSDWKQVDAHVQHQVVTTGARNISNAVTSGWDPRMRQQEIDRAAGVQEPLLRIVKKVQQDHPELRVTIPDKGGTRTPEEQAALVARGTSKTMQSAHLDGRGIDLVPVGADGKYDFNDKQAYDRLDLAMKEAAEELGIPLSPEHDQIKGWDPGHFSLPKDLDPKAVPAAVEEPLQSRVNRATTWAKQMFPNNAEIGDAVEKRVIAQFSQEKAIKRDFDFTNTTTVGNAVLGGYGDKIPTTIEELKALDPKVGAAYENLGPPERRKINGYLAQNAKQDYPQTEQNFQQFMQLKGMAESDPVGFMGVDAAGLELPRTWRKEIWSLQQQKNKSADQDPRVTHALQVLRPMLQTSGISTSEDKTPYYQFMGNLQDQLRQFQENNKRMPKSEEIELMGARLLQDQHTTWFGTQGLFEIPVPSDQAEIIRKDKRWTELGVQPTEEMIRRVWVAKQYNDRYGDSVTKPKPEEGNKPTVPMSK
ncbi:MAG: hypothetical protein LAO23_19715 [Acidobacteriia bacterium]|nr:hypothetical protein [Terriglobia bacterium]